MKKLILIILAFVFLFSCEQVLLPISDNSAPKSFSFGDTISIAYHQIVFNQSEDVSIRFKDLVADSRCPIGLLCFWAGDADVEFTLKNSGSRIDFNLHTYWDRQRDTVLADYYIKIIDVKPYPQMDYEYRAEQYEAYIIVNKIRG